MKVLVINYDELSCDKLATQLTIREFLWSSASVSFSSIADHDVVVITLPNGTGYVVKNRFGKNRQTISRDAVEEMKMIDALEKL